MGGKTSKNNHPPLVITRPSPPVSDEPKDPQSKELLKYVVPTGLYKVNNWDRRLVRKAVLEKQLAPLYPGSIEKTKDDMEECPICFMYYPSGLNRSNCCKQGICSECYLQMRPHPTVNVECPFCKRPGYSAVYKGPLSKEEREREEQEQRKVLKLQEEIRLEEEKRDSQRLAALKPTASAALAPRSSAHGDEKEKKEKEKKEKEPKEPKEKEKEKPSSRTSAAKSSSSSAISSVVSSSAVHAESGMSAAPAPARADSEASSHHASSDSEGEALDSPMLLRLPRRDSAAPAAPPPPPAPAASSGSHGPIPVRPSTPLPAPPRASHRKPVRGSSNAGSSPVPADADEEERQLHEAIRLSLLEAAAASTYNARLPSAQTGSS